MCKNNPFFQLLVPDFPVGRKGLQGGVGGGLVKIWIGMLVSFLGVEIWSYAIFV